MPQLKKHKQLLQERARAARERKKLIKEGDDPPAHDLADIVLMATKFGLNLNQKFKEKTQQKLPEQPQPKPEPKPPSQNPPPQPAHSPPAAPPPPPRLTITTPKPKVILVTNDYLKTGWKRAVPQDEQRFNPVTRRQLRTPLAQGDQSQSQSSENRFKCDNVTREDVDKCYELLKYLESCGTISIKEKICSRIRIKIQLFLSGLVVNPPAATTTTSPSGGAGSLETAVPRQSPSSSWTSSSHDSCRPQTTQTRTPTLQLQPKVYSRKRKRLPSSSSEDSAGDPDPLQIHTTAQQLQPKVYSRNRIIGKRVVPEVGGPSKVANDVPVQNSYPILTTSPSDPNLENDNVDDLIKQEPADDDSDVGEPPESISDVTIKEEEIAEDELIIPVNIEDILKKASHAHDEGQNEKRIPAPAPGPETSINFPETSKYRFCQTWIPADDEPEIPENPRLPPNPSDPLDLINHQNLDNHMLFKGNNVRCPEVGCGIILPSMQSLICHKKMHNLPVPLGLGPHPLPQSYLCSICGTSFRAKAALRHHLKIHSGVPVPVPVPVVRNFLSDLEPIPKAGAGAAASLNFSKETTATAPIRQPSSSQSSSNKFVSRTPVAVSAKSLVACVPLSQTRCRTQQTKVEMARPSPSKAPVPVLVLQNSRPILPASAAAAAPSEDNFEDLILENPADAEESESIRRFDVTVNKAFEEETAIPIPGRIDYVPRKELIPEPEPEASLNSPDTDDSFCQVWSPAPAEPEIPNFATPRLPPTPTPTSDSSPKDPVNRHRPELPLPAAESPLDYPENNYSFCPEWPPAVPEVPNFENPHLPAPDADASYPRMSVDRQEVYNHLRYKCRVRCPEVGCGKILASVKSLLIHKRQHRGRKRKANHVVRRDPDTAPPDSESESESAPARPPPTLPESHLCSICGNLYKTKRVLTYHLKSHSGEPRPKNFLCDQCPKAYWQAYKLRDHVIQNHPQSDEKPGHVCRVCGMKFRLEKGLKKHSVVHLTEMAFKCKFCDRAFKVKRTLTQHLGIHTGVKKHKCGPCGLAFVQIGSLKCHNRKHHGGGGAAAGAAAEGTTKSSNE